MQVRKLYKKLRHIAYVLPRMALNVPYAVCRIVGNFFYWGWVLRHDVPWDYDSIDRIVLLKLRQMHRLFASAESMHDPSCQNYAPKMRSIKLALRLAERLEADAYQDNPKYPLDFAFEKITEGSHAGFYSHVPLNPHTKQPATNFYRELALEEWSRKDRRAERDRAIMYRIIAKYGTYWWD